MFFLAGTHFAAATFRTVSVAHKWWTVYLKSNKQPAAACFLPNTANVIDHILVPCPFSDDKTQGVATYAITDELRRSGMPDV